MGFKSDGIRWKWDDTYTTTTADDTTRGIGPTHTTTYTTGDPIEIEAPSWKIGDKVEINSPINYGWVCPCCGRVNAPWAAQCSCSGKKDNTFIKIDTSPAFVASPCQTCSNNPANGGSGNCNCTLGTCPVIC